MKTNELLKLIDYKSLKIKEILFLLLHTSLNSRQCFLLLDQQLVIFNEVDTPKAQAIHFMLKIIRKRKLKTVEVFSYEVKNVLVMAGLYNNKVLAYQITLPDSPAIHRFINTFHQKIVKKDKQVVAHTLSLTSLSPLAPKSTRKELFLALTITAITFLILFFLRGIQ